MKQTAVEWLIEQLTEIHPKAFKQAKAMEKEQMEDMFNNGVERGYDCYHSNEWAEDPTSPTFEQYYNKTFKSE